MLNFSLIITLLVFCLNLFVGYKVWRLHSRQIANQRFFFLVLELNLLVVLALFFQNVSEPIKLLFLSRFIIATLVLIFVTFYLFLRAFFNLKNNFSSLQLIIFYLWTTFVVFLSFTPLIFISAQAEIQSFSFSYNWGIFVVIGHLLLLFLLSVSTFFRRIPQAKGLEKTRSLYLLSAFSLIIVLSFFFDLVLPLAFNNFHFLSFNAWLISLIATGIIGHALVKVRFTSLRFLLAKMIYYLVLFFWIIGAAVFLFNLPLLVASFYYLAASSFLLLWSVAFIYIYRNFQEFLIKKIVCHNLDWPAEKKNLFKKISRELNLKQIIQKTLEFVSLIIKNEGNLIYEDFADNGSFLLTSTFVQEKNPALLFDFCQKKWQAKNFSRPIILEELRLENRREDRPLIELMKKENYAVIFPLVLYSGAQGILVLGNKINRDPFFIQDLDFLEKTLTEILFMIDRAVTYQNVENFNNYLQKKVERATRKLIKTNDKLIAADKIKDEFVSVASHELRTPMTAIKNYLWLVNRNNNDHHFQENKKFIKIALDSTDRLINMVNDMLTISRIEGDRFDLNQERIDLNQIVDQVHLVLNPLANDKNVEFKKKLAKKPVFVSGDIAKITEVVQNIVGNALKFTQQGQVILSCYQDNDQGFIAVKDTGPGIATEDFSKLFKKFCRLENSYVKIKETGTGLGLYIAKQIMLKHRGDIIAESTFGKGSTFTLVFPLSID